MRGQHKGCLRSHLCILECLSEIFMSEQYIHTCIHDVTITSYSVLCIYECICHGRLFSGLRLVDWNTNVVRIKGLEP